MSKRVNYSGEPSKRAKPARSRQMTADQIRKNSGEKKGVDQSLALTPVIDTTTTNASSFVINLVEPGNGSFNRVGRKIYNKSLRIQGDLVYFMDTNVSNNHIFELLRMVVVWDKQPSGAIPTWQDIFSVTAQDGTETSSVLCPPAYDNMNRFQVLRDKTFRAPSYGGSHGSGGDFFHQHIDEYIKLGNRTTVFSGQSSPCTIADISSGACYVFFRSTGNSASYTVWSVENCNARLRYTD